MISYNRQTVHLPKKGHCNFGTTLYNGEVLNASMLGLISSHQASSGNKLSKTIQQVLRDAGGQSLFEIMDRFSG